jgi:hypothetical protein
MNTVSLDPNRALAAIHKIADRSGKRGHALTAADILDILVRRYGFDEAVAVVRAAA